MKKIIGGILGIFLVIGIVAGTGYALFSSQVTMTDMVLGTATPQLQIAFYDKSNDTPYLGYYSNTQSFTGQSFQPLLPGEEDWGAFFLKNNSTDGQYDPLDFSLKGSITAAVGDWELLKDVIKMKVCVVDKTLVNYCDTTKQTSWYTLAQWNTEQKTLPGGNLLSGTERPYVVVFKIDSSYGNSIAGLTIRGMTMEVTGTQVL